MGTPEAIRNLLDQCSFVKIKEIFSNTDIHLIIKISVPEKQKNDFKSICNKLEIEYIR